jgi:hypothetical protein
MNMTKKAILALTAGATALALSSCTTGDVGRFYTPVTAGNTKTQPELQCFEDPDTAKTFIKSYVNDGYRVVGYSSFSNLRGQETATAMTQAKKVGANIVIYVSRVTNSEIHAVAHTVMDSPGGMITTNVENSGTFNVYGNDGGSGFGNYSGSGYATTWVPPTFHTDVVPETFWRTQYAVVFLAKN